MAAVIASNIPATVSKEKLSEFFSFAGKIDSVTPVSGSTGQLPSYKIAFASEKALQTALLLNGAELDGNPITVEKSSSESLPEYKDVVSNKEVDSAEKATHTGDEEYDDVPQEEKPKYAIMAQLLASGYAVSDQLIDKAIATDKDKGYSNKFLSFLDKLDSKYVHSKEPESTTSQSVQTASDKLTLWSNAFNKSSYKQKLDHYYISAANSKYGKLVHNFYKSLAKDALDVHEEARRLADLKKSQRTEAAVTDSTAAGTTPSAPSAEKLEAVSVDEKK